MKSNDDIHFTREVPKDQEAGASCLVVWWWGKVATHLGDSLNIVTAWLFFNPLNSCLKLTIHYPQTPDESEPWGEEAEFVVWVLGPHQLPAPSSEGIALFTLFSTHHSVTIMEWLFKSQVAYTYWDPTSQYHGIEQWASPLADIRFTQRMFRSSNTFPGATMTSIPGDWDGWPTLQMVEGNHQWL